MDYLLSNAAAAAAATHTALGEATALTQQPTGNQQEQQQHGTLHADGAFS